MKAKLKNSLKRVPFAVSLYQFLRARLRRMSTLFRRSVSHRSYPRAHFETLFAKRPDPWDYGGPHQQERLKILLRQIPQDGRRALEAGCAEGMFTAALAERVEQVIAVDISGAALKRAKTRCLSFANVSFVQADLLRLPFRTGFDVIICAGVLGYFPEPAFFYQVAERVQELLIPGGHLVLEHRWETGDGSRCGKDIHEHFISSPGLHLCNLLRRDEYGISVFQRIN
jgi:SAM-dependent methyltransferase